MTVVLPNSLACEFIDCLKKDNITYNAEKYRNVSIFLISKCSKSYICSVLSNFIINNYIKKYVNSYLCKEFYFFDKKERENIIKDVLSKVDRDVISDNLKRFIDDKGKIVLDGYFRFRMQDYVEHIELIVCEAVTDIMLENEENEFVNLLKYFVSIGDGACETVHVFKKDSDYILTDDIGNSPVDMVNVMYEFSDLENLPEDTLLSNLVSIAPKKIIFHNLVDFKNNESLNIIYKVFENSIEFCGGKCQKCREMYDIEKL